MNANIYTRNTERFRLSFVHIWIEISADFLLFMCTISPRSPQRTDHQWDLKKRASWLFSPLHTPKSSSASFSISDRDFSFLSLIRCFDVQHFVSLSVFCHFQGNEASYALDMCSHCKYHLMSLHHVITSNTVGVFTYKHLLISTSVDLCICIHFEYIKAGENLIEQTSEKSECGLGFW